MKSFRSRTVYLFAISVVISIVPTLGFSGGSEVRNGGDFRRLHADLAKDLAESVFRSFEKPCDPFTEPNAELILGHARELSDLLSQTEIRWVERADLCFTFTGSEFIAGYDCAVTDPFAVFVDLPVAFLQHLYPNTSRRDLRELYRSALEAAQECHVWGQTIASDELLDYRTAPLEKIVGLFKRVRGNSVQDLRENRRFYFGAASADFPAARTPRGRIARKWALENYDRVIADLQSTPFSLEQPGAACASTNISSPLSPIRLGIACREVMLPEEVQWLLIHEIAHHLGVDDELDADLIARFLSGAFVSDPYEWSEFEVPFRLWLDGRLGRNGS